MVNPQEERTQLLSQLAELNQSPDATIDQFDDVYLKLCQKAIMKIGPGAYKKVGRGAVVIDLLDAPDGWRRCNGADVYYMSREQSRIFGVRFPPKLGHLLETYNPEHEIIVLFVRTPPEEQRHYLIEIGEAR
jgi:hypothetical protein